MPPAEAPPQSLRAAEAWPDPGSATAATTPPVAAATSTAIAQTNRRRGGTAAIIGNSLDALKQPVS
jgi:hypothetical protein